MVLLTSEQCAHSVRFAISTRPHGQQHGIAHASALLLRTRLALLLAQQVLPPRPELLLADAAGLPHQLLKQCIQVSASKKCRMRACGVTYSWTIVHSNSIYACPFDQVEPTSVYVCLFDQVAANQCVSV